MGNDVKWIKLLTSLPDDEKIKLIESMPDRDAIFYIWIRLLIQAGKCNDGGYIYLAPDIPFSDEQLSTVFNRPLNTIRLALATFKNLRMIEIYEDGHIFIPRFPEIQNIEGMEKIREQGRLRQDRYRKRLQVGEVTQEVTLPNAPDKNRIDKIRKEDNIWAAVLERLKTQVSASNYRTWLEGTTGHLNGSGVFIVVAKNTHVRDYLSKNQRGLLQKTIAEVIGSTPNLSVIARETPENQLAKSKTERL